METAALNPFPGLRPFDYEESHLFFGRDGQSNELLSRLSSHRFVAVVGTSSSGKSSLVRAGLLPALHGGMMAGGGSAWRVALLRPGGEPIGNLAQALSDPAVLGTVPLGDFGIRTALAEATLRRTSLGLIELIRQARLPPHENVLIVVDQFEELFRYVAVHDSCRGDEAAAFVSLLLAAVRQVDWPIYVVLTMRADFLGDCARFSELPETLNAGSLYLVPRMTRDQCREAVTGPILVGGGQIATRLVSRLLNDIGENQDHLPLLQHAMMRTWDIWSSRGLGEPIDIVHYEAIGTMAHALSMHADETFMELQDDRRRAIAKTLFKALTEKGADNREIRRPTALTELCAVAEAVADEVVAVIDVFRRQGRSFLMPPSGIALEQDTIIDISHESLVRNWQRLSQWVDEEAQAARTYRRLAENATFYDAGAGGLLADPELALALDWREEQRPNAAWARRYQSNFEGALGFLERSRHARDQQLIELERQSQRSLRRTRALAGALAVLALIGLLLFVQSLGR